MQKNTISHHKLLTYLKLEPVESLHRYFEYGKKLNMGIGESVYLAFIIHKSNRE